MLVDGIESARASLGGTASVDVAAGDHAVTLGICERGSKGACAPAGAGGARRLGR